MKNGGRLFRTSPRLYKAVDGWDEVNEYMNNLNQMECTSGTGHPAWGGTNGHTGRASLLMGAKDTMRLKTNFAERDDTRYDANPKNGPPKNSTITIKVSMCYCFETYFLHRKQPIFQHKTTYHLNQTSAKHRRHYSN